MRRSVSLIEESEPNRAFLLDDQLGSKSMGLQMQVRHAVRACQQGTADFAAGRIAVRVQNARSAVRGLACERQLRARAIELRAPFDELPDILRPFLNKQLHGFGQA